MIAKTRPALFSINLIRELRDRERKSERKRRMSVILGLGCFGFFVLSLLYSGLTMWQMEKVLASERSKVDYLQQEYRKYTATKLIVDKADIELLNDLQNKGVFWTRKLAAMAKHLPDNYWITHFVYANEALEISGAGYISPKQDQLLVLNEYLNRLKADTTFSNTFKRIRLDRADRVEDAGASGRMAFKLMAFTSKWREN